MLTLCRLYTFPIKSCKEWKVPVLQIGPLGPVRDREFMLIRPDGTFLSQRQLPRMCLIQGMISEGSVLVSYEGDTRSFPVTFKTVEPMAVTVQGDTCWAVDQGDEVARWFSDILEEPCRLVLITAKHNRRVDPTCCPDEACTSFTDGFPILLISKESFLDLNRRILAEGRPAVPNTAFRANFWVSGCDPYEEDTWERIRINNVEFDVVKPCARCAITQVNPATGEPRGDKEPLKTLSTFRMGKDLGSDLPGVLFGQNLVHRGQGHVTVGHEVEVLSYK